MSSFDAATVRDLEHRARLRDADACFELAERYFNGARGVERDVEEAQLQQAIALSLAAAPATGGAGASSEAPIDLDDDDDDGAGAATAPPPA